MSTSSTQGSGDRRVAASTLAMAGLARERAALYGLLATLFRHQPNQQLLLSLRSTELREALTLAGMNLDEDFFNADVDELSDELAVEFTHLFLLPGHLISPHESVQLKGGSGLLRGPETARVREYYTAVGFEIDPATPMEPDHVSIELEFLGHLAGEEASAWESGDSGKASDALHYQQDFLEKHPGRWLFDFLQKVESESGSDFYRGLARLTADLCAEQQELLPQLINRFEAYHEAS
ncbi:TorD/DmsD family molecular chaperone [Sedimenticola hydrogenitrophicus]|uniref:TorD/DmsD family molecular chaperone n=1 Tax=Sedimenticola hydrogenitrophicus TaxID=2967975 RepID=UPI0021A7CC9C|nr:molecular chaperone TorD family protein [Sedimenticola hydrogenitrophicus]